MNCIRTNVPIVPIVPVNLKHVRRSPSRAANCGGSVLRLLQRHRETCDKINLTHIETSLRNHCVRVGTAQAHKEDCSPASSKYCVVLW